MKRLPGITFSAVLLIAGGAISSLIFLLSLLGLLLGRASLPREMPQSLVFLPILIELIPMGCAVWSIVAGIALIRLRSWARISVFVFAGILLFFCLPGLLIIPLVMSAPPMFDPDIKFDHIFKTMMAVLIVIYSLLVTLAVWWLYYFNTRRVKDQFHPPEFPLAPPLPPPLVVAPLPDTQEARPKRPISITVIAVIMLATAAFLPFSFILLRFMNFSMPVMGFWIEGWPVAATMLVYLAVQVTAGVGLLKLKPWARTVAIGFFSFGIVNSAVSFARPGSLSHMQRMVSDMMTKFKPPDDLPVNLRANFPDLTHLVSSSMWFGLLSGIILAAVQLWFLFAEKKAFLASRESTPGS